MLRLCLFVTLAVTLCGAQEIAPPQEIAAPSLKSPSETIYSVHVPRQVRPGFEVVASIAILKSRNPIQVTATFTSADRQIHFSANQTVQNDRGIARILLGKIPITYKGSKKFNFTVEGVNPITKMTVFTNFTSEFQFETKSLSLMIQTDKPIFQPGQKKPPDESDETALRFRALCMTPELRPLTGVVTYKVQDPKGNVILLKSDVILTKGVASGELFLNRNAMEGEYTISFDYKGTEEKLVVTVQSYTLPKFEVKVTSPKVVYPDSEGFNIYLSANYTFNRPVYGQAVLKLERKTSFGNSLTPPRFFTKTFLKFEGKLSTLITLKEMEKKVGWGIADSKLEVTAFVTETLTSTTLNSKTVTDLKMEKIKVEVLSRSDVAKPGLKYKALVQVIEQDGNLLMESDRLKTNLELSIMYRYKRYNPQRNRAVIMNFQIPPSGLIPLEIDLRTDNFTAIVFTVTANNSIRARTQWSAPRALSPSDTFLQITHQTTGTQGEVNVGEPAEILIRATKSIKKFRVTVISRGIIVRDEMIQRPVKSQQITYVFPISSKMMPSILILVSYIKEDNREIVADSLKLKVKLALQNQMTISTSHESLDAGSIFIINATTTSTNSFVGLRAVDKRVLLLRSGNDITEKRVVDELNDYSDSKDFFPSPFFTSERLRKRVSEEIFDDAKVNVLTNALLYKLPRDLSTDTCLNQRSIARPFQARVFNAELAENTGANTVGKAPSQRPRTLFPETWIWTSAETENNRSVLFNFSSPDSITSWHISAFSMSESHGLGIATPQELTVFRKFFITLNMPLKITSGEIVVVQAIVFNYFEQDVRANIRLNLNGLFDGVELLNPGDDTISGAGLLRQVDVPAGSAVSVKYPLRITRLGETPIRITATSALAVDSVIRNIFVKAEGVQQCYTSSVLISKSSDEMLSTVEELSIRIPQGIIRGSANAYLHVYGDVLGSAMTNLGNLLTVPNGCGEQNMINFAPNVFVALYLQRIGRLTPEMRKTAIENIIDGYMNQLRYKRIDGSFSAFGERDASGSTWLTAFVVKCFNFARQLQPELVEKSVIDQAVNFLTSQQNRDGSFKEPGRVIHQDMQGGVNSPITMTAYVLITLTETQTMKRNTRLRITVQRAINFLERNLMRLQDPYELSLVTYALTLAESRQASDAFERLNSLVVTEGGVVWPNRPLAGSSAYSPRWQPPYSPPVSYQIEATSYLLLTYAFHEEVTPAFRHLKWLVSKQNQLGGYSSTQDTVMAVQTLWKVSALLDNSAQNLNLEIRASYNRSFTYPLLINQENSLVYNSIEISPLNGTIRISALGSGLGVAQLSVCYNIPTSPYEEEPFRCKTNITSDSNDEAWLDFCCALKEDDVKPTGMFLFEIEMLNGFTVDVLDEERRNSMAKLIELKDGRVNVYYNQLLPREELCTRLKLVRVAEVAAIKPATIKAFEYYKPAKIVVRQYNVSGLNQTDVCDVCGYECVGCPAPILSDWKDWTPCVEFCEAENSTRERECMDPSLNKKIDFFRCGIKEIPTEIRQCNKTFSCPSLSDGLWYQLPQSFISYEETICRVNGRWRSPYTVIPGSMLNGYDEFLRCSINLLNAEKPKFTGVVQLIESLSPAAVKSLSSDILQSILNSNDDGFTISFLTKPHFYKEEEPVVFISVGEVDEQPILVMEKPIQRDFIRLVISIDKKRDFVEQIPLSTIPIGKWSHIMIVWNERSEAKVFVNGTEAGRSSSVIVEVSRKITKNLQFNLGKKEVGDGLNKGYFPGSFSALHFWTSPLPNNEIEGLSTYYKEILKSDGTEPLLSVRHLRELVPQSQRQCFIKPQYLSHIYAEQKCG